LIRLGVHRLRRLKTHVPQKNHHEGVGQPNSGGLRFPRKGHDSDSTKAKRLAQAEPALVRFFLAIDGSSTLGSEVLLRISFSHESLG